MRVGSFLFVLGGIIGLVSGYPCYADFIGWRELRVIEQDGRPFVMRAADFDADGRQELIIVNSRFSRLDIYHWLDEEERSNPEQLSQDQPNDLAMTNEVKREELQLERLPQDVMLEDLDADGLSELIVLVSPPLRVLVYKRSNASQWELQYQVDLLEAEISSRRNAMLIRQANGDAFELLVSCTNGIQQLELRPGGRPHWFTPREEKDRSKWWLADLDADGRPDLVEQTSNADEAIRWYRCASDGCFLPAETLYDRAVSGAEVLGCERQSHLILLDGTVSNLLRRYELQTAQPTSLGQRRPIALVGGQRAAWCGLQQGAERALIVADPERPRLLSYVLGEEGWKAEQGYPGIAEVQAIAAPAGRPGSVLIWAQDAAELCLSQWQDGRLTYPRPWPDAAEDENSRILALKTTGDVTWWVQTSGRDLLFHRWSAADEEPSQLRFPGVGQSADEVLWIGGRRLLVKEKRTRGLKLYTLSSEDKVDVSAPAHLAKADLDEFQVMQVEDELHVGRFTEGVLQWLGEDLRSSDQIMLSNGQRLAGYVADDLASGWALQRDAPYIHHIETDEAGVKRSVDRIKIADGSALMRDRVLGLLLQDSGRLVHLSQGTPRELQLIDIVDERVGRASGVRETHFHRLDRTDIDADGRDELLLFDDLRHRLCVLSITDEALEPEICWPVFDDKKYPYEDESTEHVREPRAVLGLDLNADGRQDLAMVCHDRLIIYLAASPTEEAAAP